MAVAAVHKARVVAAGDAENHPLMELSDWRQRHAAFVLMAAGVLEVAVATLLIAVPSFGLSATLLLLAVYSLELKRLAPEQHCNCLGNFLRDTRTTALRRNAVLALIAGVTFAATASDLVDPAGISQATIGGTILVGALLAPMHALRTMLQRSGIAAETRARNGGTLAP